MKIFKELIILLVVIALSTQKDLEKFKENLSTQISLLEEIKSEFLNRFQQSSQFHNQLRKNFNCKTVNLLEIKQANLATEKQHFEQKAKNFTKSINELELQLNETTKKDTLTKISDLNKNIQHYQEQIKEYLVQYQSIAVNRDIINEIEEDLSDYVQEKAITEKNDQNSKFEEDLSKKVEKIEEEDIQVEDSLNYEEGLIATKIEASKNSLEQLLEQYLTELDNTNSQLELINFQHEKLQGQLKICKELEKDFSLNAIDINQFIQKIDDNLQFLISNLDDLNEIEAPTEK